MTPTRPLLALGLVSAMGLTACGGDDASSDTTVSSAVVTINVGRTTDPASQLLAEIYGQGLENSGFRVGRKDPVADRAAAYAALESGKFSFVAESSLALLAFVSDGPVTAATAIDQMAALGEQLPDTLTAAEASGADVGLVVACSQAAVEADSLSTVSDLAEVAGDITLGGSAEFEQAASFGLAALNETYDTDFSSFEVVEADDASAALADGTVDCVVASAVLPTITVDGLIVLDDDKGFAPEDVIVPLLATEAATPDVLGVLTSINASLTTDVLRALLVKAEVSGDPYDVVAKDFLASISGTGA